MTTMIAGGRYQASLPMSPAEERLASAEERFEIALTAVDFIQQQDQQLPYADLRKRVMQVTGLDWAAAALAIRYRQDRPRTHDA